MLGKDEITSQTSSGSCIHTRGMANAPKACAACKMQRKKCSEECVLAPHFPADDPHKFAIVKMVFGATNVVKMLKSLKPEQREDAVKSIVCEATARVENPVHGSASVILELQKFIVDLESQLAARQAELLSMRSQHEKLVSIITTGCVDDQHVLYATSQNEETIPEGVDPLLLLDPLWDV